MKSIFPRVSLVTAASLLLFSAYAHAAYKYTELPTLGGEYSVAAGLNNAGQIIGSSGTADSIPHATLWQNGTAINISPSYYLSRGNAINDAGQITGNYQAYYGRFEVARAYASCCSDLGTLGGSDSIANDINNGGIMVGRVSAEQGWAGPPTYPFPFYGTHAAMWNGTSAIDMNPAGAAYSTANAINDAGQIVGAVDGNAVIWNAGVLSTLGNGVANDINNAGHAVGRADDNAVMWADGTQTVLGSGSAAAINILSQVVGTSAGHAFLWDDGTATDLNHFLGSTARDAGWILMNAVGINDSGWIVGTAFNTVSLLTRAYILSPVPEPQTWLMLLLGLGLIGWIMRDRIKAEEENKRENHRLKLA